VYSRGGDSEEEEDEEEVDSDEDSNSSAMTTTTRRRLPSPEEEDAATRRTRANIAASFQRVAVTHLTERTSRAVEWANDLLDDGETLSCVVVAGGVASNAVVRERLSEVASRCALPLVTPPPRWCVDNGVMVAWAGVERLALGLSEAPCTEAQVAASPSSANRRDVPTFPRWPLGERDDRATGHVKSAKTARIAAPLTGAGGDGSARFPGVVAPGVVEA
jgi:hypothetical protein